MNPKIAELAEQATHTMQFSGEGGMLQTTDGETTYDIPAEFIERFAELIVRECANRATWAQDTGAPDIGGEVLQHFGVEE